MTMNLKNLYQNEYSFEETVNENFFKVDSFTHLSIFGEISSSNDEENTIAKELYLITQPQADENGIITPDTLFQDKINQIACYHNNIGWLFYTPKIGDIAYIRSRNGFYYFTGAQWNIMTTGSSSGGSSTIAPTPTSNTGSTGGTSSSSVESISLNNPFSLGMIMRSKTQVNHPSWLKSDATLKSGAVYASMYSTLLDAFNNGTAGTIEIGDETYNTKEKDGFVVIDSNDWQTIYSNYGIAAQFGIDTTNQQFYLPYGEESKRELVESKQPTESDKTWYNLYSDGWLEQGGECYTTSGLGQYNNVVKLVYPYESTLYFPKHTMLMSGAWNPTDSMEVYPDRTATSFTIGIYNTGYRGFVWTASGYLNSVNNALSRKYYDYYYVGETIQSSNAINLDALITKLNTLENRVQELENA